MILLVKSINNNNNNKSLLAPTQNKQYKKHHFIDIYSVGKQYQALSLTTSKDLVNVK